jgi:rRNA maturation endonuclease Nob1
MAEKTSFREVVSAALTLLAFLLGFAAIIWGANSCQPRKNSPKHFCPYCGQEIRVNLEKNGEKKP